MQLTFKLSRFRYVLMLLVGLVLADGVITEFIVNSGLGAEGNPFLQGIVSAGNLMPIKIATAALSAILLGLISQRLPKGAALVSWSFIVIYTLILYWNLGTIILNRSWI